MSREIRIYCDRCTRFFYSKRNERGELVYERARQHGWSQNRDKTLALCPNCKARFYQHLEFENEEDWMELS